uniref:Transposable element P transposase-like RNase H domain-containing protein n=1 Tax=Amphimedon queenslandica TaxID=400682 RepID=A0A1X7SZ13_AMPQE
MLECAQKYEDFIKEKVQSKSAVPVGQGVLIWDEVKVQSRIIWNSSNSAIIGYSMSSDDFISLHDVYQGLSEEEKCQKTSYVIQFLWRDLSSSFDVVGPYYTCPSSIETKFFHSIVTRTMLVFSQFGFHIRALLCDGASNNLSLLKVFCGYVNNEKDIQAPWFKSPFDGEKVYLIVCPSHQLKNMIAALYSSRVEGTKNFCRNGTTFGWSTIESVYRSDLCRAQKGISRRVPGLKYSYIVRDSWTRLNVLPAKIMQQPYMISAIREIAEKKDTMKEPHSLVANYLRACNMIFENGILSHEKITSMSSRPIVNMAEGMKWFFKWKEEEPDMGFVTYHVSRIQRSLSRFFSEKS